MSIDYFCHPTADVAASARIGAGTQIWHEAQVSAGARIGRDCTLGKGVYVGPHVEIGSRCKLQNRVSVFVGVTLEDGVFCGPHATFTNDRRPRAINPDQTVKDASDWSVVPTLVRLGASIGAGAVIVCGVTIGRWAMVGAGAVVTRDVPDHALVVGIPARWVGWVCACGNQLTGQTNTLICPTCQQTDATRR